VTICDIENCDNQAAWKLHRPHDDEVAEVCYQCRDELMGVYLWDLVGPLEPLDQPSSTG